VKALGRAAVISAAQSVQITRQIRYDTIEEFNVDSKAEYTA